MIVRSDYSSGHLRLSLSGELDHASSRKTMQQIEDALDRYLPKICTLDLSELSFMDSSGIAVFFRAKRRTEDGGGALFLANPAPQPDRVISAAGVGRWITVQRGKGGKQ